jgi:hypothetical protein
VSLQTFRGLDLQPQHPDLSEWLSYWKIPSVLNLSHKITILEREETKHSGFADVLKGSYDVNNNLSEVDYICRKMLYMR